MNIPSIFRAGLAGLALGLALPGAATAQPLRILAGSPSAALQVPMNRAVVVESDIPFVELSIANPGIADISSLTDRTIYVLGKAPGRTTLTVLGENGRLISNVEVQVTPDIAEFKERLEQILPGELGKALELIEAGEEIDYVGATAVELIEPGESAGTFKEIEIKDGAIETVGFR